MVDLFPIFYIHKGSHTYFRCSLIQCRRSNPDTEVYVLGDVAAQKTVTSLNPELKIKFFPLEEYLPSAKNKKEDDISNYYFHVSPNSYEGELFCIQRWFILNNYTKKHQINKCFYMDSDVLLYTTTDSSLKAFSGKIGGIFGPTVNICRSLHTSYFTSDVLSEFCAFMLDSYKNNRQILDDYLTQTQYHISDMSLAALYLVGPRFAEATNLGDPRQEERETEYSIFDERMEDVRDIVCSRQCGMTVKKIFWSSRSRQSRYPLVMLSASGQMLRLRSLHFQGGAKSLMPFYIYPFPHALFVYLTEKSEEFLSKTKRKIKKILRKK